MSRSEDCPSSWEARREGERAFERGRSRYSTPYADTCEDADYYFRQGYRAAEDRREEQERAERADQRRREEEHAQSEEYMYQRMEEEQYMQYCEQEQAKQIAEMEREQIAKATGGTPDAPKP